MIQVIKYKCCGIAFAGCREPECYTSKEWINDVRKYALEGFKIEMVENGKALLNLCTCQKDNQLELNL